MRLKHGSVSRPRCMALLSSESSRLRPRILLIPAVSTPLACTIFRAKTRVSTRVLIWRVSFREDNTRVLNDRWRRHANAQAMKLGFLPRMTIHHMSSSKMGQIYIPVVNFSREPPPPPPPPPRREKHHAARCRAVRRLHPRSSHPPPPAPLAPAAPPRPADALPTGLGWCA